MRVCGCGSGCVWVCVGVCVWVCVCVFAFAVIFVTLLRRVAFRFKGIVVQLSVSSKLPAPRSYPDAWPHCQRVTDVGSADGRHALSYQRHSRSSCPQSHLRSTGYAKRVQLVRLFSPSRALSLSLSHSFSAWRHTCKRFVYAVFSKHNSERKLETMLQISP